MSKKRTPAYIEDSDEELSKEVSYNVATMYYARALPPAHCRFGVGFARGLRHVGVMYLFTCMK